MRKIKKRKKPLTRQEKDLAMFKINFSHFLQKHPADAEHVRALQVKLNTKMTGRGDHYFWTLCSRLGLKR